MDAMEIVKKVATIVWKMFLFQWPYAFEISIFFRQLRGAAKVREKGELFWFHSIVLMIMTCYAGGTLSRLLMAKPPVIFTNDYLVPLAIICWLLINRFPNDAIYKAIKKPFVKEFCILMTELYRGNSMLNTIELANRTFPASKYYSCPLFGPILVGIIATSSGNFLPLTVGLKNIETRVPWNIQCGMITAVFYHLAVHDDHVIGSLLRNHVFGPHFDRLTARFIVIAFFAMMGLLQNKFGPHFNPFGAVHRVLYQVTNTEQAHELQSKKKNETPKALVSPDNKQVPVVSSSFQNNYENSKPQKLDQSVSSLKPEKDMDTAPTSLALRNSEIELLTAMKKSFERVTTAAQSFRTDLLKTAFIILTPLIVCGVHTFHEHPSNILLSEEVLHAGEYLGYCTYLSPVRKCTPRILLLQEDGVLAEYEAASPREARHLKPVWMSSNTPISSADLHDDQCSVSATIEDWSLKVKRGSETIWSTPTFTKRELKQMQHSNGTAVLKLDDEIGLTLSLDDVQYWRAQKA